MGNSFDNYAGTITPANELEQVTARLNQYVAALAERDQQILSLIDEVERGRARLDQYVAALTERDEQISSLIDDVADLNNARAKDTDMMAKAAAHLSLMADELDKSSAEIEERDEQIRLLNGDAERQRTRLDQYVAAMAERDAALAKVTASRDRFQSKGRQLLAEVAELRGHADAIRKFAGGRNAMLKAIHPDTALPEHRAARDEIFKLVQLIFAGR